MTVNGSNHHKHLSEKMGIIAAIVTLGCAAYCTPMSWGRSFFAPNQDERETTESLAGKRVRDGAPIPTSSTIPTTKDFLRTRYVWLTRMTVEAYDRNESKNPKWNAEAIKFLLAICKAWALQSDALPPDDLLKMGKDLIDRGCDEPLVVFWHAMAQALYGHAAEAEPTLRRMLPVLEKSSYPRTHVRYGADMLAQFFSQLKIKNSADFQVMRDRQIGMMAEAVRQGEYRPEEMRIAFSQIENAHMEAKNSEEGKFSRYGLFLEKIKKVAPTADPWFLKILEGYYEVDMAWNMRGDGFANTVKKEGWKGFHEHLVEAARALTDAWKLRPEFPEAAAKMINVAMAGGGDETPRVWFDRAVRGQLDYSDAYSSLRWALRPRWGGSHEEIIAFGTDCLESKRFDTLVPFQYLIALRDVAGETPNDAWRLRFRAPGVAENLETIYKGSLAESKMDQHRDNILAQWAVTLAWCGRFEEAKKKWEEVKTPIQMNQGFWNETIGWGGMPREQCEAEIRLFTGPMKEELLQAERILPGKLDEALAAFSKAMEANRSDKEVCSYLRDRIARARFASLHAYSIGESSPNLLYNCITCEDNNDDDLAMFLIENGAPMDYKNKQGFTPLHAAIARKKTAVALKLIEKGAILNTDNNFGYTPLYAAIKLNDPQLVRALLDKGADPNALSNVWTHLDWAAYHGNLEIVKMLVEKGADINKYTDEVTPLSLSVFWNRMPVFKYLMELNPKLEYLDENKNTVLLTALRKKNREAAKILIAKGANVNVKGKDKKTPLQLASQLGYKDIVELLKAHGATGPTASPAGAAAIDDPDTAPGKPAKAAPPAGF